MTTEFNDSPGYAGAFGAIVAPSGHQFYEMQWLRERRYVEDSIATYFRLHSSKPYAYTSWLAENVWSLNKVHRNDTYATELLSELVKYYEHYEEMQFNSRLGLFWSAPVWDAMERTASSKRALHPYHGGDGYRPTLNSYMYANALAIARIADMAGDTATAARFRAKAAAVKTNLQNRLWDSGRNFFLHMYRHNEGAGATAETLIDDSGLYTGDKKGREQIGFIPWAFNLPDDLAGAGYEAAWQYFTDTSYFKADYGPTTVEQSDHRYGLSGSCCHWSGQSWPFATTQSLKAMANVLQNYTQTQIDKADYDEALDTYVDVHMRGRATGADAERPYIAEANHPDTGSWAGHDRNNHSENYFHSGFVDLVITGLLGLQPQRGDALVLKPLVPDTWDYFILDNLRYHGRDITVIWDRDGTKYDRGTGFQVFVGDTSVYHSATVPATATIDVGAPVAVARDTLMNFAVNNTGATYPQATATRSHSTDQPGEAVNGKYFYTDVPTDRWTSYNTTASQDTFTVNFGQDRTIHTVKLYLFDDGGGVQVPSSYAIQYWNGTAWAAVTETSRSPASPTSGRANTVEFTQVSTSQVRAVLTRNSGTATGMTEFEAWGPAVDIPDPARGENLALNTESWKYPRIYPSFGNVDRGSAFRVHDGETSTFWSTQESRNGANEFLRVDFDTETTFDTVVVEFRDAADSVTLEYLSGGSWVAIPGVHMTPATPADNTVTTATFPAVTAREVRVNFTTAATLSPTSGFTTAPVSVNELEIYDLSLTGLTIDHSTPTTTAGLEPAFDPATLQYSAAVPPTATAFTVTAQRSSTAGPDPTIEIWTPPTADNAGVWTTDSDGTIDFPTTNNTIRVRALVTTTDNTPTKTYTIDVRRQSSDANLSALALSGMALSPAFDPATTSYSAVFGAGVTSTAVAAVTADAHATVVVKLGGVIDADGIVALGAGANTVTVEVTADDGTTKVYTVTATRAAANDASLSGLSLSGITLSPAFDPATTSYSATVHHSVSSTVVTADAAHDDATSVVKLGGVIDADGTVALAAGANTVTVEVTNGAFMRVYTVTVTRPADTTLSGLSLSGITLSPAFDPETASYSATVVTGVSSSAVAATVTASGATVVVKLGGVIDADGTVALAAGENTVTVEVTNGAFMRVYTVTATRPLDTSLSALSLGGVGLWPAFDPETASYSATVGTGVSSSAVAATVAASGATVVVKLGGVIDADGTVALAVGENTVTVEVTNGAFMGVYTVTVTRLATTVGLSGSAREALMTRFDFWYNEDWDWYRANIPFVETPDDRLDETYYYRWQLVTTHLRYGSPQEGYVTTEFNDSPGYAGAFGAIVAPSGHQFYEMQWLRERRYVEDSIATYFRLHSSKPYAYTSWLAENVWSLNKVHRNDTYATELLSELVKYYEHYEEMQFNSRLGLFWSAPVWDAMERTASSKRALHPYHGGDGYRPTLNSYMYANALAIARIADMAGDTATAARFRAKAAAVKTNLQNRLWDSGRNFFLHMYRHNEGAGATAETLIDDSGLYTGDKKGREQIGFIPWAFNLPDDLAGAGYEAAWQYFTDTSYFKADYGPTTVEQSDHRYGLSGSCCHWSGQSWPFATTQSLKAMANVLQNYTQTQIDKADYDEALDTYVDVHMRGRATGADAERPYIAEANHPDTGSWAGHDRNNHSENYFHSGFVDLVITGLLGLQPQRGDALVLKPLVPDTWDYFILDNLRYHGRDITVIWDRDGTKYDRGTGFQVFVGDTSVYHSATVPATATIDVGAPVAVARDTLMNFAVNNTGATYPQATATRSHSTDQPGEAVNGKYFYTDVPTDRWTSYNTTASQDTFTVNFGQDRTIHTVKLYLFDDGGGVQVPSSYAIQYWNGTAWAAVTETSRSPASPTSGRANTVEFTQVSTSQVRAVLTRNSGTATGMTEFEAWGPAVDIPDPARGENLALNTESWKYPRIYPSFGNVDRGSAFRVHDGETSTFWSTQESRNGANEFLRVDFDTETTFDTVVVEFRDAADSVTLEYLSGGSWVAIPGVHMTPATPADNTVTTATFPAVTAREVRVNFTTAATLSPTSGFTTAPVSVNELEIYDLSLTGLTIDHSTPTTTAGLEPAFDPATLQYSAAVPPTATAFTVTAQRSSTAGPDPTIEIWTPPTADNAGVWTTDSDGAIDFPTTNNTIRVRALVTTTDNTPTKTYTIDVRRQSSDANLSALALSGMALSPAFDPATTSYSAVFGAGVTSTAVAAVTADAHATVVVKLGGVIDADGTVALGAGANTVTVEVTAEDGTTKVYTVTATRAAANDASLSGLSLSGITLSPAFDPETASYSATVHHSVSSAAVTATVTASGATVVVKLGGVIDADGTVALAAGANTVTVEVTNGAAMRVYTVTVTRPADTSLSALSLGGVGLWPAFDPETASYSATVGTGVSSSAVAATVAASGATVVVKLGGVIDADGTVALASGANTVTVEVTNGAFMGVYTVTVTRLATTVGLSGSAREALMTRFDFWYNEDWDWYRANIPFVETPDDRLDETYYYRWQLVTTHLRYGSPQEGYVTTEFNDSPGYAGAFGAIVAPSGHQFYEMQWLRERRYVEDSIATYFRLHSSKPYAYTSWLAENVWSLNKVHRNDTYATELLSELVKYYEHYEEMQFNSRLGLFWSAPVWDAMERTASSKRALHPYHGGDGYRPTLNSYMYANALAIARIADMAGDTATAARFRAKAAAVKTNLQNRLWDSGRNFFLHMYRHNEGNGDHRGDPDRRQRAVHRRQEGPRADRVHTVGVQSARRPRRRRL